MTTNNTPALMDMGVDLTVKQLIAQSHELSVAKGWYDGHLWDDGKVKRHDVPVVEKLALIHSEISGALEAYRDYGVERRCAHCDGIGKCDDLECGAQRNDLTCPFCRGRGFFAMYSADGTDLGPTEKPEGFIVELADAVIRIADLAGALGLDLEAAIRVKHVYNATRPQRHGGKRC